MKNLRNTGAITGKRAFSLSKTEGALQAILLQPKIQKPSMTPVDSSKYPADVAGIINIALV